MANVNAPRTDCAESSGKQRMVIPVVQHEHVRALTLTQNWARTLENHFPCFPLPKLWLFQAPEQGTSYSRLLADQGVKEVDWL